MVQACWSNFNPALILTSRRRPNLVDPLNGEFIASASTRSIGSPPTQVANLTILSLCSRDHLGSVSSCCRHFDSCPQLKLRGRSYVPPRTPYLLVLRTSRVALQATRDKVKIQMKMNSLAANQRGLAWSPLARTPGYSVLSGKLISTDSRVRSTTH